MASDVVESDCGDRVTISHYQNPSTKLEVTDNSDTYFIQGNIIKKDIEPLIKWFRKRQNWKEIPSHWVEEKK